MNANEYQKSAARTLVNAPPTISVPDLMLVWNAIGLAGEAGEIADHIKKGVFHQHGLDHGELIKELGDLLWYIAALCTELEVPMELVMATNITKLQARYPNGFSTEDSRARQDMNIVVADWEEAIRRSKRLK